MIPLTDEKNKYYEKQEDDERWWKITNEDDENYKKNTNVKDHCRYTRKFRGAAHSIWNVRYKDPKDIPVIIHNASYDTHFIINQLAKKIKVSLIV